MRSFAELELDPELLSALDDMGYQRPTLIQSEVIPHGMDGRDILASAPTGTGKTAAFLLPMLQHLLDFPRQKPGPGRVLVLTPTRELAIQVADEARALAKNTSLKIFTITGGISYQEHAEQLGKTQDIVVATPGRLMEYIEAERFDCRAVECLILDEADRMLDMGFANAVNRLSDECQRRRQTMLFSATLEGRGVAGFTDNLLDNPELVDVTPPRRERKKIIQWYHRCDDLDHKRALLKAIVSEQAERAIVFIKTRERLAELRDYMQSQQLDCAWIQGEMQQAKRNNAINRFSEGKVSVLLATDVAARGIDVPDITHVINYDLPRTADVYLHRIGRTARAGKKGSAISLVEAHDQPMMDRIMRYMDEEIKERTIASLKPKHKKAEHKKKKKKQSVKNSSKVKKPKKRK
ncbi:MULTISPECIES: ATP-dependent RNA helicase SrmB [unclassified Salinivibrio]|uniref:ATP-dependent RNA helicase SrmB n=1 Tax=unclassified Salinivibrio TaxID=2636825 RepID=UPI0012C392CC|nr:ATP-dependent RNA helicase SrmB [Salinivibrio sp. VYel7]MPX94591.1 ATP-dependent RNA helicase SrmB [Salinivibrio sp. VYel9]MPX97372.1 ATP-dependent RNA helicase SrmB [Salinivibrio sp. VYel6]MPY00878.1 ATP-dependent RNA helicase SrmB [Salinivibrio sp. VYel4]MPY03890.1 ATP-dependent RNA helicase SrmB [Salinivibrio sp. VYel5]MPY06833.1 ATP-dependent RNA helicase SrmB [Salinivibrio sp. VYel8]MPY14807.1 ATP-dependent RNA helicase SrmB [Salinivibrio sp. VGrn1]